MAAYGALVSLKSTIGYYLKYYDICLTPPSLRMLRLLHNQIKSFEQFLNSSDCSTTREQMTPRLHQIALAMREFDDILIIYASDLKEKAQSAEDSDPSLDLEYVRQAFDAITASLKELQQSFPLVGVTKSKLIGLSDQYNHLKKSIFLCRFVISVVGMAGNGKTTLAEEIFRDLDVVERFDLRAWVGVGRSYSKEAILRSILDQIDPSVFQSLDFDEDDEDELGYCLGRILEGKRYLIVFDDVCDTDFWYKLEFSLPDDNVGSKVVLTTRSREVADYAGAVFDMRLLSHEESWELLRDKVFGDEFCPPELVKPGKKIAEYCDGLPLTIVSVSKLLSKAEKTLEFWNELAARKKHQLFLAAYDAIMEVLYPSYWDLSQQLRICFLYMGVFPQDYKIPRSKIVNLWISDEGLLDPIADQYGQQFLFGFIGVEEFNMLRNTPEQVLDLESYALEYLEDLVSKTLVMVYEKSTTRAVIKRSWARGVKTCGLHSSWWHLCYKEATKRHYFCILNSLEDGVGEGIKGQTTLSLHNNVLFGINDVYESILEYCESSARSLLCFGPYHQYQVPICYGLRSLERLDALNIRLYEFPCEVTNLVELRYLALTCNGEIPPSISKLSELRFLIVHRHFRITKRHETPSYLPTEIWDMKELRYLEIMGSDILPSDAARLPNLSKLLQVSNRSCSKGVFQGIPKLSKLGIRIELTPYNDDNRSTACLDHVSLLKGLESLKCVVVNPDFTSKVIPPPTLPTFPARLKKLTLSGLGCLWADMSKIALLKRLEVLKLRFNPFRETKWDMRGYKFVKLEYLLIEDCDLERLEMGDESFDGLKYLCLRHCYKLKELVWESGLSISNIEVVDCNPLIEKHMKKAMLRSNESVDSFSVHSSWLGKLKS